MLDKKALIVARREYLALVRSKAFLGGLVMAPLLMALTTLLVPDEGAAVDAGPRGVALVDRTGKLESRLRSATRAVGLELELAAVDTPDEERRLEGRVERGELAAVLIVGGAAIETQAGDVAVASVARDDRDVVLVVQNLAGTVAQSLGRIARHAVDMERLIAAGIETRRAQALLAGVELTTRTPDTRGDESMRALLDGLLTPVFTLMLVFMAVMSSAPYSLHAVIEEKQQRIAEVLLGCMSPVQLMTGKLLGTTGAGLTVVLAYASIAYLTASRYGLGDIVNGWVILLSVVDALIAILLFGAIFLAIGAASSELKDAQGFMGPMTVVMMLPLMLIAHLIRSPDGALAVGLSLFPLTAPLILPVRLSLGSMPAWQIAISVAGTLAFTAAAIWAAGRVFRIGILAQGQAPRLRELIAWIRRG